jgi:hypothetical protein
VDFLNGRSALPEIFKQPWIRPKRNDHTPGKQVGAAQLRWEQVSDRFLAG